MSKILLLHQQYRPDDQVIWRTAIKHGWQTYRVSKERQFDENAPQGEIFRYYGNMLDASKMESYGIKALQIPLLYLERMPLCLTKRAIKFGFYKDIKDSVPYDMFIKCTGIKWFAAQIFKKGAMIIGCNHDDDTIYCQEPVKFLEEIRCFCLDGRVLTASHYRNKIENIDNTPIFHMLDGMSQIVHATNLLPRAVVMDFGYIEGRGWAFIEANESWASGLYDCNPDEAFKVITESQTNL